ncbi:MAG TPA: Uma2 family endonuclease [Saprospiraceae bacterium]|nr:Uma2 family endonuclease [Saprospiraceae bacterium]HMQ84416.1 Uma2 family endonuclease [Saprospiraceae bacterium]
MFEEKDLVDKIMELSDAVLIVQQAQERLKTEQVRRQEFYQQMTEDDKAEFVNGAILYHSPVAKAHNDSTGLLYILLHTYVNSHDLGFVGVEKILIQLSRNDYEPDLCFFGKEKAAAFTEQQLLFPVPDFIAEVLSKSSTKTIEHDTVTKYKDYERHGVDEYWIIDPYDKTVSQYILKDSKYDLCLKAGEGIIQAAAIPGFSIPIAAIFEKQENLAALKDMLL